MRRGIDEVLDTRCSDAALRLRVIEGNGDRLVTRGATRKENANRDVVELAPGLQVPIYPRSIPSTGAHRPGEQARLPLKRRVKARSGRIRPHDRPAAGGACRNNWIG